MNYQYIEQLLDRYWECQTTLEEENILRAFFSQDDVPASLLQYKDIFVYEAKETHDDVLGEEFDKKMLQLIGEEKPVKAKVVSLRQRLMPLFKAAAVVAVILTIGNALQMSFDSNENYNGMAGIETPNVDGVNVAQSHDSLSIDTLHRSSFAPQEKEVNPF